jgi:ABC-type antimicrobial peptide transport system permease subunit
VSVALIAVALVASAIPAYRATRVSPLIALRTE